jgi:MFS family permease
LRRIIGLGAPYRKGHAGAWCKTPHRQLGRKRFFLISLALFTISSVLCGLAWTLPTLLLCRIMQGLGGGGMVPVATSILVDAFPRPNGARPSRCSGLPSWWPRWSGQH